MASVVFSEFGISFQISAFLWRFRIGFGAHVLGLVSSADCTMDLFLFSYFLTCLNRFLMLSVQDPFMLKKNTSDLSIYELRKYTQNKTLWKNVKKSNFIKTAH